MNGGSSEDVASGLERPIVVIRWYSHEREVVGPENVREAGFDIDFGVAISERK